MYVDIFDKTIDKIASFAINSVYINEVFNEDTNVWDSIKDNASAIIFLVCVALLFIVFKIKSPKKIDRKIYDMNLNYDKLTGIATEYKFIKDAKRLLDSSKSKEYVLVSIDIDNFKYINEYYGMEKGNDILQIFSRALRLFLEQTSVIGRYSNDIFLILMPVSTFYCDLKDSKYELAIDYIQSLINYKVHGIKISISQGFYKVLNTDSDISYMIDCANVARKHGKNIFGNTMIEYSDEMNKKRKFKNEITSIMEKSLVENEFKVYYQPKYLLDTHQIIGAEALIRWHSKELGNVNTATFIDIFEKNGFITKIDYYVLETVCKFIKENSDKLNVPQISVNLSAITLQEKNLKVKLCDIVDKYEVPRDLIEFEITESAIVEDFEYEVIEKLRLAGFRISLDDFGSGTSSLNKLKDISIDILKIDREFLNRSLDNDKDRKGNIIIKNVIAMAKELELKTVAEGVETLEHVELLRNLGCDIAQGYYFSRPLEETAFVIELTKNV